MYRSTRFLLLALLLPALAACDSFTDTPSASAETLIETPADPQAKLRHWDLLSTTGTANKGGDADSVGFVVTFSDLVADPESAAGALFSAQAVKTRSYYRDSFTGVSVTASKENLPNVLNRLIESDLVAFVEPDVRLRPIPSDPTLSSVEYVDLEAYRGEAASEFEYDWYKDQLRPWNMDRIEAHKSSTRSGDGKGSVEVDVYLIDGPVDHPDLNVVERVSFLPKDVTPASALHGSHVAGVIGAVDDETGIVGVAPGARIHSLEVLDADGATTMATMLDAVEFVTARKQENPNLPLVANISVGVDLGTKDLNALDEAVAKAVEAGVVVVVSAGNGAIDAGTYSPAHAPGAIAVGASDAYDHFAESFSNFGKEIDLFAPGVDILSTADAGRYAVLSGTSMAAPHVAGAAALYLSNHPEAAPNKVLDELQRRAKEVRGEPKGTADERLKVKDL